MTWSPKVPADFAGESAKITWELVPYTRGVGIELGCGPHKAFPHFIGIDRERHEGKHGPQLVMDCANLAVFSDGAFDFVYSSHLLEHIEDTRATLAEWWRVIDVGGHLVLYLPHRDFYPNIGEPGGNPDHKHDFVPADIVEAMREVAPDWELLEQQERSGGDEYSFLLVFRKLAAGGGQRVRGPGAAKRAAVMRPGAYGDMLFASSILRQLKLQGYHVTLYTEEQGEEIMRHDPHIDRIVTIGKGQIPIGFLARYFEWEAKKYDRAINLLESIEKNAIAWPTDCRFAWPDEVRRKIFGRNYLELVHDLALLPYEFDQRFYPTEAERAEARAWRRDNCGDEPMIVIAASGSTLPKFWPHLQRFVQMVAAKGTHAAVLGDLRDMKLPEDPRIHAIGMQWPMRRAMALAQRADAVIGQETGLLNAVAMEPMRKIVLLSHSSRENLVKHWFNTVALEADVPCHPCHRIHMTFEHCVRDAASGAATCQSSIPPEDVMRALDLGVL